MQYFELFIVALWDIIVEMSPYLLLGFLIAGVLHAFIPGGKMNKWIGRSDTKSVLNAALLGIPMPLCSCGVIPTGISFYKQGAAKGPTLSFLVSTPQTGVDSIFVTYALLGLPLAIIRPIIALVAGMISGLAGNWFSSDKTVEVRDSQMLPQQKSGLLGKTKKALHYGFVILMQDIAKTLAIGLIGAAVIAVIVPENFFIADWTSEGLNLIIVLLASIPLYVCATASVPIAAVLMGKGLSAGAAIVFLMAGPATNLATISVIGKVMGKKSLFIYLGSIMVVAIASGLLINQLAPSNWFDFSDLNTPGHSEHLLPHWLHLASAVFFILLLVYAQWERHHPHESKEGSEAAKTIIVKNMECNHCKIAIERELQSIPGVTQISADVSKHHVSLQGIDIDLKLVEKSIIGIGYDYGGEVAD